METTIFEEYNIEPDNVKTIEIINNNIDQKTYYFNKISKKIKNKINNLIHISENNMVDINLNNIDEPIIIETNIIPIIYDDIKKDIIENKIEFQKIEKIQIVHDIIKPDLPKINLKSNINSYNIDYTIIEPEEIQQLNPILSNDNKITFHLRVKEKEKKNNLFKKIIDVDIIDDYNLNSSEFRYTKIINLLHDKTIFQSFIDKYIKVCRKDRNKQKINRLKKQLLQN
jgi:hypothetical protein